MKRVLILMLVLANVMAFAYLDDRARHAETDTTRAQQIHPERIRPMSAREVRALQAERDACVEIGPFNALDLAHLREVAAALQPPPRIEVREAAAQEAYLRLHGLDEAGRTRMGEVVTGFAGVAMQPCAVETTAAAGS